MMKRSLLRLKNLVSSVLNLNNNELSSTFSKTERIFNLYGSDVQASFLGFS